MNPSGLCQCGCGQRTNLASQTSKRFGWVKGQPLRYVLGHVAKNKPRDLRKYRNVLRDGRFTKEHTIVVEAVLGHALPKGAVVHHVNHIRSDNRPENLVVCQDHAYHMLIHTRERALMACGNANWRLCRYCHAHDDIAAMSPSSQGGFHHLECRRAHRREVKQRRKVENVA